jgi:TPR repeat protein
MSSFDYLAPNFSVFEEAAAKGHESALMILKTVERFGKDIGIEDISSAFRKLEDPLAWVFAGDFCEYTSSARFHFYRRSAEAGCSEGQVCYADYFTNYGADGFVVKSEKVYVEWLEKAANQNSTRAMAALAYFHEKNGNLKVMWEFLMAAAELGNLQSMARIGSGYERGVGKPADLCEAMRWYFKGNKETRAYRIVREILEGKMEICGGNVDRFCYCLGAGLFWHGHGMPMYNRQPLETTAVLEQALEYYCLNVDLQQESLLTFLMFWNRRSNVKQVGSIIAKMVWNEREDKLIVTNSKIF